MEIELSPERDYKPRKETNREKVWVEIFCPLGYRFHSQRNNEKKLDENIKMFKNYYGDKKCHTILITNHKYEIIRRY